MGNKVYYILGFGCAFLLFIGLFGGMVGLGVYSINLGPDQAGASTTTPIAYGDCSLTDLVPPNFAAIFCEAEEKSKVPAGMVAAIYLTEHHTNKFGKDIKDINDAKGSCSSNSSGAAGPMQFIPSSWNGIADNLERAGIKNPDRCKYRDSIIGAGFLLRGKSKFPQVAKVCKIDKEGKYVMTDECISWWGQSYCGLGGGTSQGIPGCGSRACSTKKYLYCLEAVKKYHKVT